MTRDEARDYIAGHGFDPELPGQQGIARFAQEQITRLVNGGGPEHFSDYERARRRAEISRRKSSRRRTTCSAGSRRTLPPSNGSTSPAPGRSTALRCGRWPVVDRHCSPTGEPLTELALAEDLVAAHAGVLRYVRP